jgi:hypothetical protein
VHACPHKIREWLESEGSSGLPATTQRVICCPEFTMPETRWRCVKPSQKSGMVSRRRFRYAWSGRTGSIQQGDTDMLEQALSPTVLQDLKARLRGELICPGDRSYNAARKVWNDMIDKHPAVIVRCADVVDASSTCCYAEKR